MTRKHFQAIADTLRDDLSKGHCTAEHVEAMASTLSQFNPNFNYARFISAVKD